MRGAWRNCAMKSVPTRHPRLKLERTPTELFGGQNKRPQRKAPQKWLWRPAAVRLGGVSPPGFRPQVDDFPTQPYSRSVGVSSAELAERPPHILPLQTSSSPLQLFPHALLHRHHPQRKTGPHPRPHAGTCEEFQPIRQIRLSSLPLHGWNARATSEKTAIPG